MSQRLLLLIFIVLSWAVYAEEEDFSFEDPFGEEEVALPLGPRWEIDFTREFQLDVFQPSPSHSPRPACHVFSLGATISSAHP